MKMYFVCRNHKQVFCAGDVDESTETILNHHRATSDEILRAISRFIYAHCGCDAGWITENHLYEMELQGYRRIDADLGIPFKGPPYMTVNEASEALKDTESETGESKTGTGPYK